MGESPTLPPLGGILSGWPRQPIYPMSDEQRIFGRVDIYGIPVIKTIEFIPSGKKFGAGIDTGSAGCIAKFYAIEALGLLPQDHDGIGTFRSPEFGIVKGYAFDLKFRIEDSDIEFEQRFTVLKDPEFPYDILLGAMWLKQIKELRYFGTDRRWELFL